MENVRITGMVSSFQMNGKAGEGMSVFPDTVYFGNGNGETCGSVRFRHTNGSVDEEDPFTVNYTMVEPDTDSFENMHRLVTRLSEIAQITACTVNDYKEEGVFPVKFKSLCLVVEGGMWEPVADTPYFKFASEWKEGQRRILCMATERLLGTCRTFQTHWKHKK